MKIYSYYFEELVFKFNLNNEEGAHEDPWSESDDFPSLSPREAMELSKEKLLELLKRYPWAEPEFSSCSLKYNKHEGGWWYYDIEWMVWPPEMDGSDKASINIPVMLNGKIPPFQVYKYGDRSEAWKT